MPQIPEILENKRNIDHLSEARLKGRLSHAYIINGPKGSGKNTFVRFISSMLLCDKELKDGPCGTCPACARSLSGNHPDIVFLKREKEKTITVGEVRQQIIDDISVKPYYGPFKIYIIEDAQLMNESAQNALLKTIEEPPEYAVIFLLSDNADSLLDTIRSRCIRLDMDRIPADMIRKYLKERAGVRDEDADRYSSFAMGNLGRAMELAEDESFGTLMGEVTGLLKQIKNMNAVDIFDEAASLGKNGAGEVIELARMWYRDLLIMKAEEGTSLFDKYFPWEASSGKAMVSGMTYEDISNCLKAIDIAEARMKTNVKAEAVLENMFLEFRKNSKDIRIG